MSSTSPRCLRLPNALFAALSRLLNKTAPQDKRPDPSVNVAHLPAPVRANTALQPTSTTMKMAGTSRFTTHSIHGLPRTDDANDKNNSVSSYNFASPPLMYRHTLDRRLGGMAHRSLAVAGTTTVSR